MNTNYGKLVGAEVEYAPDKITKDGEVISNPSAETYLAAGWKHIADNPPPADEGCTVQPSGWDEGETEIVRIYKQVPDEPTPAKARVFSKLKLVAALKEADKWVLVKTWIEGIPRRAKRGALRSKVARGVRGALARPYETAALFQSLVSVGFPRRLCRRPSKRKAFFGGYAIKTYARIADDEAEAILKQCIWEED